MIAAKRDAADRRSAEAALPKGLRFHKGWPPRLPTEVEATAIAATRSVILARHGLANHYPAATAITARFAELLATGHNPGLRREGGIDVRSSGRRDR